jgi:hypothetical protein
MKLLSTLMLVFTLQAYAELTKASELPLLNKPVTHVLSKFESTKDGLYLALASNRCSALLAVVQGVLKRDANRDVYVGVPDQLSDVAWQITLKKLKDRGVEVNDARLDKIGDELNEDFTSFVKAYSGRMTANRKAHGDMWSSDPLISNDIEACQEVAAALANS